MPDRLQTIARIMDEALDAAWVEISMVKHWRRCRAARQAGGISLESVVDGKKKVPKGWKLDHATDYFIPPNVELKDDD